MPITLNDAIRRVRSRVDEPAYPTLAGSTSGNPPPRQYTDTEITDWINDGLRDIARRAEDLITYDATINIPAYGENPAAPIPTYSLNLGVVGTSSDVLRITRVEFQVSGDSSQVYPLEYASQSYLDQVWNIDQLSAMSYPSFWTTRGYPGGTGRNAFLIQLYPNPSQAGILNVFYYRLPVRIGDPVATPANYNLPLDVIEGWDDMVVDYAVVQAFIKTRNPDWQNLMQLYESKMNNLIDNTRRISDQSQYLTYDNMVMPWAFDSWGGV